MTASSSALALLDRATPPPFQAVGAVPLLAPEVLPLAGGGRLHILRNGALPVVQVQVVLPAGQWQQPAPAVAALTARAITEGTRRRTAAQIAEYVAIYGAFLENSAGADRASLTLYALRRHLPALLPLLGELLTEATFPEADTTAAIARYVQQARVEREKNATRASERFSRNLFGAAHPYSSELNLDAVAALTPDHLRGFYAEHYRLGSAEIFMCGDVRGEDVAALLALAEGARTIAAAPAPLLATPAGGPARDEIRLPQSQQSSVRMGRLWPGPKIFGGYFGSRLMKNIREDKGFTYGIYSSISHREYASSLVVGADVNADSTEATCTEIACEMARLRAEPVPAHELATVRQYAAGKLVSETSTIFDQLGKYQYLVLRGLPPDHYDHLLHAIRTTTPDELLALANEYLVPEKMTEVVVGRRD